MSLKDELEHEAEPEPVPEESAAREREVRDLSVVGLGVSLVLLAAVVAVAMGGMGLILGALETREAARRPQPSPLAGDAAPPSPRLETLPGELRRRQETAQEQILDGYAWLDREQGIVRIPIERAMDVLVERGLPARGGDRAGGGEATGAEETGGDAEETGGSRLPGAGRGGRHPASGDGGGEDDRSRQRAGSPEGTMEGDAGRDDGSDAR